MFQVSEMGTSYASLQRKTVMREMQQWTCNNRMYTGWGPSIQSELWQCLQRVAAAVLRFRIVDLSMFPWVWESAVDIVGKATVSAFNPWPQRLVVRYVRHSIRRWKWIFWNFNTSTIPPILVRFEQTWGHFKCPVEGFKKSHCMFL